MTKNWGGQGVHQQLENVGSKTVDFLQSFCGFLSVFRIQIHWIHIQIQPIAESGTNPVPGFYILVGNGYFPLSANCVFFYPKMWISCQIFAVLQISTMANWGQKAIQIEKTELKTVKYRYFFRTPVIMEYRYRKWNIYKQLDKDSNLRTYVLTKESTVSFRKGLILKTYDIQKKTWIAAKSL